MIYFSEDKNGIFCNAKHESQPFNFKKPDDWSRWKSQFDQFRIASGSDKDPQEKHHSTLIYCTGEQVLF